MFALIENLQVIGVFPDVILTGNCSHFGQEIVDIALEHDQLERIKAILSQFDGKDCQQMVFEMFDVLTVVK